jgi:uncharacterized membrane protein affecting hemolysin expression
MLLMLLLLLLLLLLLPLLLGVRARSHSTPFWATAVLCKVRMQRKFKMHTSAVELRTSTI